MARQRHLPNAPIVEAAIFLSLPKDVTVTLDRLEEMARSTEGYPDVAPVERGFYWTDSSNTDGSRVGFRATSPDGLQIAQFRIDGFSFTRLQPYTKWSEVSREALRLWTRYYEAFGPTQAHWVSVRYVNHLRLPYPLPEGGIHEFILGMPQAPDGWPPVITNFISRLTLLEPEVDPDNVLFVHVTHSLLDDPDESRIGVGLDIEAQAKDEERIAPSELESVLGRLRELKNRIFFNGLTEDLVKEYDG